MDTNDRITDLEATVAALTAELAALRAERGDGDGAPVERWLGDRDLLANLPDVINVVDRDLRILYRNRPSDGAGATARVGASILDSVPAAEREWHRQLLERAFATGELQQRETRTAAGSVWDSRIIPMTHDGRVAYLVVSSIDVSQRARAEDALRESESRLRHAIEATGMGTWIRDEHGVRWDAALCRIMGVRPDEVPEAYDGFFCMVHPDDRERCMAMVERFRATGRYEDVECRIVRPDGTIRHVLAKGSVELDASGYPARSYGGIFDMTERVALEAQLRQAQKMDAIGQLTAGIAHNFNNVLGAILPNAELCRRQAPPELTARLDAILHASERGADMVRQLMHFVRHETGAHRVAVDLTASARRTVELCRATFDRRVAIDLSLPRVPPQTLGDAGQLEQAMIELLLNARDALEEAHTPSPRITVRLDSVNGGVARIRVSDNGPGMDDATRARVFDPFFTTKAARRGTGLGLASAYAIVLDHGGRITCESRVGEGTSFEIRLPATQAAPVPVAEATSSELPLGDETILVVDDEPLVRTVSREVLELGGFTVLEAADGAEALEIFDRLGPTIAAVVLDRSMPGLSGEEVLARLVERDPTLPVVMLSGHLGSAETWERTAAVLTKPASARTLLRTVRDVIDRAIAARAAAD